MEPGFAGHPFIPGQVGTQYTKLINTADQAFRSLQETLGNTNCKPGCVDCCHAVFGLFFVEALVVHRAYRALPRDKRRGVENRAERAEKKIKRLLGAAQNLDEDNSYTLFSKAKIQCPMLLEEGLCAIYAHRPITCRVYGMPTSIKKLVRCCPKSLSKRDLKGLPTFDLDSVFKELYRLSFALMGLLSIPDTQRARLLTSMPQAIKDPFLLFKINPPGPQGQADGP